MSKKCKMCNSIALHHYHTANANTGWVCLDCGFEMERVGSTVA